MRFSNARDQHPMVRFAYLRGDTGDLRRRFAFAENDFREVLAQGTVQIDFGKSKVRHRGGLEGVQDLLAADVAGTKFFQ